MDAAARLQAIRDRVWADVYSRTFCAELSTFGYRRSGDHASLAADAAVEWLQDPKHLTDDDGVTT